MTGDNMNWRVIFLSIYISFQWVIYQLRLKQPMHLSCLPALGYVSHGNHSFVHQLYVGVPYLGHQTCCSEHSWEDLAHAPGCNYMETVGHLAPSWTVWGHTSSVQPSPAVNKKKFKLQFLQGQLRNNVPLNNREGTYIKLVKS